MTLADLTIIRTNFRKAVTVRDMGDLTNDNFVDFNDFRQWKNNFAGSVPNGLGVPEPSGVALALWALWKVARRERVDEYCN